MKTIKVDLSKKLKSLELHASNNDYCVYKHTSPSGKVYIGITCQNPLKRWKNGQGYITNDHFYRAIMKYGWDNIKHEILFDHLTQEEAEKKEIELISLYDSTNYMLGYNKDNGGSGAGRCTEDTKFKLSNAHKGKRLTDEHKGKLRKIKLGTHLSQEAREKISNANSRRKLSEETKRKISESEKGKYVSEEIRAKTAKIVKCIETQQTYVGIREAERMTGIRREGISRCCLGKQHTAQGFHFEFA